MMPCTIVMIPFLCNTYAVVSQRVIEPWYGEEYGSAWAVVQKMERQAGAEPSLDGETVRGRKCLLRPNRPSRPSSTVQPHARKQGHLGHRKTWYDSQEER